MILRLGTKSEFVTALQVLLQDLGLYEDEVDSRYGPMTRNAVEDFQEGHELMADGIAGPLTLSEMGIDWAEEEEGDAIEDIEGAEDFVLDDDSLNELVDIVVGMYATSAQEALQEHILVGMQLVQPYLEDLGLDSVLALSLFFGQIRQEIGRNGILKENLNYKCSALPKLFKVYRSNGLANQHGRCNGQKADQEAIANHAYANRIGNGDAESGDGALFKGAGFKQLTGRSNYQDYHDWLEENLSDVYMEQAGDMIMEWGYEALINSPHAFLSAVYFWHKNELYDAVQYGLTRKASDAVTKKVNRHTDSYAARWKHTVATAEAFGLA